MNAMTFPFEVTSGIAQAVAKILDGQKNRRINIEKCAEQVARHLETARDDGAAKEVREALDRLRAGPVAPQAMRLLPDPRTRDALQWHEPTDLSEELALDPAADLGLSRLAAELAQASRILAHGIDAPTRALFHGPSGTGKTLAVRWLGGRLGLPVAILRLDQATDSYMGVTGRNVAQAIETVGAQPTILFLDEIDGLCGRRDGKHDVEEQSRVTSALFQQLDALVPRQIVIAATNFQNKVDPALVRRFPTVIPFGLPTEKAREAMLRRWWGRMQFENEAIRHAVQMTFNRSGAETRALAMAAARAAILEGEGSEIRKKHVDGAGEQRAAP